MPQEQQEKEVERMVERRKISIFFIFFLSPFFSVLLIEERSYNLHDEKRALGEVQRTRLASSEISDLISYI
jgi:hypothetical protein